MRHLTTSMALFSALLLLTATAFAQSSSTANFAINGHVDAEVADAPASLVYNKAGKVWILSAYKDRFRVSLFFSKDFTPAAGTFPVQFRYRGEKDTLGGSVIVPTGEGRKTRMYSHDTAGEVTFSSFDGRAIGTFEFKTYNSYKESKNEVTTQGSFDVAVPADAFQ
jgi:hypothetical protein